MTSDVLNFIHEKSEGLKPKMLFMKSLKWKYLVRNILRGKNIMMTGLLVVVRLWRAGG